ncbi:MFS transporter [Xanthobacter sp. V3C-3]|uniref:MFS transporter n=1 Tax=Xanthobacter lutulentifluminis TaxID=3119935 RepID=UPI0037278093
MNDTGALPPGAPRGRLGALIAGLMREPAPLAAVERHPSHLAIVVALVCTGAFIGQLDATIVQLALPTLGRTFDAPLEAVSWVSLAYLVSFAAFLPVFGRLCQMFGRKSLYLLGYLLFGTASALCGLASDLPQLIAFRVLQGMGGAMLGANSIAILVAAVDEKKRGRALGVFAAAQAVGMSAGPAVGGLVLAGLGWRWVFWLSVPFAVVALLAGWLALPREQATDRGQSFDWSGAALLGPALVLLVMALNHLSAWGPTSLPVIASLGGAAALMWLFVRRERRAVHPLVALRLFGSGAFTAGAVAVTLGYALLYGMFFLMSFLLEHGYGDSPRAAGFRLAVIPVVLGLVAPFSGPLAERLGAARLTACGMAGCVAALGLLWLSASMGEAGSLARTVAFAVFGAGLGVFIAPNNHETLKAAPGPLAAPAGSLLNLMRVLGSSIGVAAGTASLSFGLDRATGVHDHWMGASGVALVHALDPGLVTLAVLALTAGAVCLLRPRT